MRTPFVRCRRLERLVAWLAAAVLAGTSWADVPVRPGAPRNLLIPPQTETENSLTLLWDKPPDAAGITGYLVFNHGRQVAATASTHCTVEHLTPARGQSLYVVAQDAQGRVSDPSPVLSVRTLPAGKEIDIRAYGAQGDGRTKNTRAIQSAIDACPAGGTVIVPLGVFLTGAIFLHSEMTLRIDRGAVLQGTTDIADYQPWILNRFEGWEMKTFASLINAGRLDHAGPCNVSHLAIRGEGTIAGGGHILAQAMIAAGGMRGRGRLICIMNCRGLDIEGLTVKDSPSWTIHYLYCEGVSCHGLTIRSNVANGDGIDPDSSKDSFIFDCSFATGDDCIAIKSGKNPEGGLIGRPTENVSITDCQFLSGHGISIGSEISGGVRNVLVRDCQAGNLINGMQIKATPERGGVVENIRVRDCSLRKIRVLTKLGYNNDGAPAPAAPYFRNFEFINLDMSQADTASPVIIIDGFAGARHRTQGVRLEHIRLPAGAAVDVDQCAGVKFVDVRTVLGLKPDYHVTNSTGIVD